jgi:hypothetical protein
VFVLVVATRPVCTIAGWITGRDGKREDWWERSFRVPCYAVPQDDLRPLEQAPFAECLRV